jgi:hypothetical protein
LRSELLTTLINNDVSGKLNAGGRVSAVDKFQTIADVFASGSAEIKRLLRNFVDVKSGFLSAECCPVTARPDGTGGNKRAQEGMKSVPEALIKDADFQKARRSSAG